MNKILLNKNGRNHIRIMPLKGIIELPTENTSKFCEQLFLDLQNDDNAKRHYYYRNVKLGHQVTVYESDNKIYLTNCMRDLDYNYVTTVYISDNLNDMLNIAKFLRANMKQIAEDYKNQIIEGKDAFEDFIKDSEAKA